jgi:hypothetical protein
MNLFIWIVQWLLAFSAVTWGVRAIGNPRWINLNTMAAYEQRMDTPRARRLRSQIPAYRSKSFGPAVPLWLVQLFGCLGVCSGIAMVTPLVIQGVGWLVPVAAAVQIPQIYLQPVAAIVTLRPTPARLPVAWTLIRNARWVLPQLFVIICRMWPYPLS